MTEESVSDVVVLKPCLGVLVVWDKNDRVVIVSVDTENFHKKFDEMIHFKEKLKHNRIWKWI